MEAALKLASWNRWDADDWNLHFAANPKRERIHMAQARKLNKDSYLETKQDMSSNRRSLGAGSVISCTCILQDGTLENALVDIFMCQPQRQNDDVWETGANM